MESIYNLLPPAIQSAVQQLPLDRVPQLEEIRLRVGRAVELIQSNESEYLPISLQEEDVDYILGKLSKHSLYMMDEELRRGYVTIEGGHRVGLAGKVILENGQVKAIRDFGSFNIRIAREKKGVGQRWIPHLWQNGRWVHTLVVGAPQTGKTTLLRDLARIVSTGEESQRIPSKKLGIVDERSEIAGCKRGIPQLTFGSRVDVLDACPKAEGMMMMIRSMSPDVLVVDELGRKEDEDAMREALHAGITIFTTAHGASLAEVAHRPTLRPFLEERVFTRILELSKSPTGKRVITLRDEMGKEIASERSVTRS